MRRKEGLCFGQLLAAVGAVVCRSSSALVIFRFSMILFFSLVSFHLAKDCGQYFIVLLHLLSEIDGQNGFD